MAYNNISFPSFSLSDLSSFFTRLQEASSFLSGHGGGEPSFGDAFGDSYAQDSFEIAVPSPSFTLGGLWDAKSGGGGKIDPDGYGD